MPNTENRPSYSDFDCQVKDLSLGDKFQLTKGKETYTLTSIGRSILEHFKLDYTIPLKDKLCFFSAKDPGCVSMISDQVWVYRIKEKKRGRPRKVNTCQ